MMMLLVIRLPGAVSCSICAMFLFVAHSASNLESYGNQVSGESFHLECSTRTTNKANYATFFRSTNSGISGIRAGYREFYPDQTPSCIEGTGFQTNYTVSCNSDGSMFTLTIPAKNAIEHKTYWRCQTASDYNVLENNVIDIVIIVTISGISWVSPVVGPDNTVNVTSDKSTTFKCQTTQGRPAANIMWYLDNAPQSGETTTTTPVSGNIVTTTGSLTLTVNRTADDKVLSCKATNYVNMEPVVSTVKPVIRVKYAPSRPPVMDGYTNGTVYKTLVGRPQSVTCLVPTAYPVPTLSWLCPSYTVTGTTPLPGSTDVVSSSITWTATSTEPGHTCQCTSYQEVSGTVTAYINIDVLYAPSSPTYRLDVSGVLTDVSGSIDVIQGDTVHMNCITISNPPPTPDQYRWTRSTGGSWTHEQQNLTIPNIDRSSDNTYACEVTNTMPTTDGTSDTGRNTSQIAINVLYGPEINLIPNQTIVEGSPLNVTCTAHSNPPVTSYYWSRPRSTTRYIDDPVLHIPSVLRTDAGVYTCHVGNVMFPTCEQHSITGTGSRGTIVEVQYLPDIMGNAETVVVENQTSTVSCTADGVPATYTFDDWIHVAPDNVTVLRSLPGVYNSTTTTLTLSDVNYQDTGYYRCSVSNGIQHYITGEITATTDVMFTVKSRPVVISETSDVTANMGGNASLMVTFYSYNDSHQPDVTWFKHIHGSFENITEMRYNDNLTQSDITLNVYGHNMNESGFVTKLSVHNITEEDFTNYSCTLRNNICTTNSTVITLRPKGPPEVPKIVDTYATERSITIYFVPGFHGGSDQHFIVQLNKSDDEPFAIMANETVGRKSEEFNTSIEPLASDTEYAFMYFSENSDGQSEKGILTLTTKVEASGGPTDSTIVTGVAVGAAAALTCTAVIVAIVVILRRRTQGKPCPREAELLNTSNPNRAEKQKRKSRPRETELLNTRTNNRVEEQKNSRKRVQETTLYTNHTLVKANGVEIYKLYDYIMEKLDDDAEYLKTQFYKLQNGLCADHDVGMMKQNKNKNRYKNMIAYDHSRVHLEDRTEQQTDYVNACYILGYEKVEKFIACQAPVAGYVTAAGLGPTKTMVQDFWQMVWQEETSKIVMLTNLVELGMIKCLQYWPEAGTVVYGDVTVSLMLVRKLPDYTIRSLDIRKGDEPPHRIDQFHFQSWPDKNVPESAWTLVNFWKTVDAHSSPLKGPTIVHCSDGGGRTGTYIALDWLYNQAHVEGVVNFFDCVETMRRQRVNMVQTPTQYAFIHETVAEALSVGTLPQLSSQYRQWYTHMLEIDEHREKDQDRSTRLEVQHELFMQSFGDSGTNASANSRDNGYFDGCYNLKNIMDQTAFIVTRSPTKTEEPALLELIGDRKVKIIINLSNTDWIPWQNQASCLQLDLTDWDQDGVPCSMTTCVSLIEDVLKVQPLPTETRPILLHSDFPIERCGLLCILLNEVYRIKLHKQISILQSAKSMQTADGRFVAEPNLAQYKFCHNVMLEYLNQAEIYQNLVT